MKRLKFTLALLRAATKRNLSTRELAMMLALTEAHPHGVLMEKLVEQTGVQPSALRDIQNRHNDYFRTVPSGNGTNALLYSLTPAGEQIMAGLITAGKGEA